MNVRRGLFRVWLVLSIAWVAANVWRLDFSCLRGAEKDLPWCEAQAHSYLKVLSIMIGVPLAAFILGRVIGWIFDGFRSGANSN